MDGDDPLLAALAENGGPTLTRLPSMASPLVDTIPADHDDCAGDDQRHVSRPQIEGCDIGAVEVEAPPPPPAEPEEPEVPEAPPAEPVDAEPTFTG